tara:strand:+ start:191 stop:682 length:492 start_codon:yes stop_codon:yes gene_type:complete
MYCPTCSNKSTKVLDSRLIGDGFSIRRRRSCIKCSFRFSTVEEIEILDLTVIKRDGHRENYNRNKIIRGLKRSLEKIPYLEENFNSLIREIEREIQKKVISNEITYKKLGQIVMKKLKSFDKVAYIRYASVYRSFKDVKNFQKELNRLLKRNKNKKINNVYGR